MTLARSAHRDAERGVLRGRRSRAPPCRRVRTSLPCTSPPRLGGLLCEHSRRHLLAGQEFELRVRRPARAATLAGRLAGGPRGRLAGRAGRRLGTRPPPVPRRSAHRRARPPCLVGASIACTSASLVDRWAREQHHGGRAAVFCRSAWVSLTQRLTTSPMYISKMSPALLVPLMPPGAAGRSPSLPPALLKGELDLLGISGSAATASFASLVNGTQTDGDVDEDHHRPAAAASPLGWVRP